MPKKNRKKNRVTNIFEKTEIESAEANAESTEPVKPQEEAILPDSIQEEATELHQSEDQPSSSESDPALSDAVTSDASTAREEQASTDDLLDDVRQSLIEDETVKDEKKSKRWWRRVAKGLQKDKKVESETPVETELTPVNAQADLVEKEEEKSEEYLDEIDELIDMLETESSEAAAPVSTPVEVSTEPEVEVDLEELKKQALRPRSVGEEQENITEVRSVALEDGEEVFVEVEATRQDPLEERLTAFENALRPYRRYIYFGFTVLGIVMAVIAGAVLFNIYQQSRPVPTVNPNLPFPTSMSLPGGLNFTLGRGTLKDGQWNPQGPEWLEGTEVCRWVAIPWSRQLEAVIRTLSPDDQIELVMSNNDRLLYKVYSVQQLSNEQLQELPSDSPCLLLVLAKADTETRWVLTALP
jgi:hypothetical protein